MRAEHGQFLRDESRATVIKHRLLGHLGQATLQSDSAMAAPALGATHAAEATKDKGANQRLHNRGKAIKACEIQFDSKTTRGMVLNLYQDGADVRLPGHLTNCPEHFTLTIAAGRTYKCRVCWRVQDKVGVVFV